MSPADPRLSKLKRQQAQRRRNLKDPKWMDDRSFPKHGEALTTGDYVANYHSLNPGRHLGAQFTFTNICGSKL